jgi:hypothetical protein
MVSLQVGEMKGNYAAFIRDPEGNRIEAATFRATRQLDIRRSCKHEIRFAFLQIRCRRDSTSLTEGVD